MARGRTAVVAALLGALVLVGAAGCDGWPASAGKGHSTARAIPPAASAGGACELLDYDEIAKDIGVRFSVAAAGRQGETYTCVVQAAGASYPDLMIAVTATTADRAAFDAVIRPSDATPVDELGIVGYSSSVAATGTSGPGTEIGWLAGNGRLIVLIYHLAPGATTEDALALTPKVVAVAKMVDFAGS